MKLSNILFKLNIHDLNKNSKGKAKVIHEGAFLLT